MQKTFHRAKIASLSAKPKSPQQLPPHTSTQVPWWGWWLGSARFVGKKDPANCSFGLK